MTSKWENKKGGFDKEKYEKNKISAMSFKAKPDDIYICAFPKAGTHWTFEVVRFLLAGSTDIPVEHKEDTMFGMVDTEELDVLPSPRRFNTHSLFDNMSPDILQKKCKIIYVTRDPRDVVVSYFFHHRNLFKEVQWNDFFQKFVEGKDLWGKNESISKEENWFEYIKSWEKGMKEHPDVPILAFTFESMKRDPATETKRLAEFLGVECSEELLQKVLEKTSVGAMRSIRPDDKKYFFRKGVAGDWKNHFTVAQSELFNQVFDEKMSGTDAYKLYTHTTQN